MEKRNAITPEAADAKKEVKQTPTVKEQNKGTKDAGEASEEQTQESDFGERSYAAPDFLKDDDSAG